MPATGSVPATVGISARFVRPPSGASVAAPAGGSGKSDWTNMLNHSNGDETAAHGAKGKPLNPMVIPFIVVPPDIGHGIHMGDYAAVTYDGRTTMAVVGDIGPKGIVGEASPAVARPLRIPSDKNNGGVMNPVEINKDAEIIDDEAGARPEPRNSEQDSDDELGIYSASRGESAGDSDEATS